MDEQGEEAAGFAALRERVAQVREEFRRSAGFEEGAWGVDGHTFAFQLGLARPMPVGGYVVLSTRDGRRYLGQVVDQRVDSRPGPQVSLQLPAGLGGDGSAGSAAVTVRVRLAVGDGVLLASLGEGFGAVDRHATFDLAEVEEAPPGLVDDFIASSLGGATGLDTGGAAFGAAPVVPLLAAKGFNRHTFLCGQSGSGKTYGLGVLLERLLLHTTLDMVVLDPNSDYVGLGDLVPDPPDVPDVDRVRAHWARLRERIAVIGFGDTATPFKVVFGRLTDAQQALVLGLDPIADAGDFAAFRELRDRGPADMTMEELLRRADAADDPAARSLARRIRNVGAPAWNVWAGEGDTPVLDALPDDVRVVVADLGTTEVAEERAVQSAAVLEWLWRGRHERNPRLVVIDEAHNVCPQVPASPMQALGTDHVVRIAAEGRKYGLYLLLSTQQPQKIHANVLAQCDNLMLLRMNSRVDIDHLARAFGFVPPPLLHQAAGFRLGEGLVAGKISSHALRYRGARRWTREGGADIPTTWAVPSVAE